MLVCFALFTNLASGNQYLGNTSEENNLSSIYTGSIGDNIDIRSGALSLGQTDLNLPGRGGLDLVLTRYYSSEIFEPQQVDSGQYNQWGDHKLASYMGDGWTLMVGRYREDTTTYFAGAGPNGPIYNDIIVKRVFYSDNSSEVLFEDTISNAVYDMRTISGNRYDLDSSMLVLVGGKRYYYDYTYSNEDDVINEKYGGRYVTKIQDVYGKSEINIYYNSGFPIMDSIIDALGRKVDFYYSKPQGASVVLYRIDSIGYDNWNDEEIFIRYFYDNDHRLDSVHYPTGECYTYEYTDRVYVGANYYTDADGKVLSKVKTTYGGEVEYKYTIFQDIYEGFNAEDEVVWQHSNYWGVKERKVDDINTVRFQYSIEYKASGPHLEITDAISYLGDSLRYKHSAGSRISNWYDNNLSNFAYPYGPGNGYVPYGLKDITGSGRENVVNIYSVFSYSYPDSGYITIRPAEEQITKDGYYRVISYGENYETEIDHNTGYPLYKKIHNYADEIIEKVVDFEYNPELNNYVIEKSKTKQLVAATYDIDSVIYETKCNADLTEVDTLKTIKEGDTAFVTFEYDDYGNIVLEKNAYGYYTKKVYDSDSAKVIKTIRKKKLSGEDTILIGDSLVYYDNGLLYKRFTPSGEELTHSYSDSDLLEYISQSGSITSKTCYDSLSYNHTIIDSIRIYDNNWKIKYSRYNGFGKKTSSMMEYESGKYYKDSSEYDIDGRIIKAFESWDSENEPNPLKYTKYNYDERGRLVSTYFFKTSSDSTRLDSINYVDGHTVERINMDGYQVKDSTDFFGNVVKTWSNYDQQYQDSSLAEYNTFGTIHSVTPPGGTSYKEYYDYGKYGRLWEKEIPDRGDEYQYYDRLGRLRLTKKADGTWNYFKYDGVGRTIERGVVGSSQCSAPDDSIWYDNDYSFPASDCTEQITKIYDKYTDSVSTNYSDLVEDEDYVIGKLAEVYDPTGYTFFFYDKFGRTTAKVTKIDGDSLPRTINYTYHESGIVDSLYNFNLQADTSTYTIEYDYYDYGLHRGVDTYTPTGSSTPGFKYTASLQLKEMTLGHQANKVTEKLEYDEYGRLVKEYVSHTYNYFFRRGYVYDGTEISMAVRLDYSGNVTDTAYYYDYDNAGRLKSVGDSLCHNVYEFIYDKNGNRDTMVLNSDTLEYSYYSNTNRLKGVSNQQLSTNYSYDANGNVISDYEKNLVTMEYDHRNLLTFMVYDSEVIDTGMIPYYDSLYNYYDYSGKRVKKEHSYWKWVECLPPEPPGGEFGTMAGGPPPPPPPEYDTCLVRYKETTYYYYSGGSVSAIKTDLALGQSVKSSYQYFVYAAGRWICQINVDTSGTADTCYLITDYQGNTRTVFDYYNGMLRQNCEYFYSPFGDIDSVWVQAGTDDPRFEYNGKERDFDIYYHGARWYDPDVGRFMGVDLVKDYHNPYSYCRNNPIKYIDPSGMAVEAPISNTNYPTPRLYDFGGEIGTNTSRNDDFTGGNLNWWMWNGPSAYQMYLSYYLERWYAFGDEDALLRLRDEVINEDSEYNRLGLEENFVEDIENRIKEYDEEFAGLLDIAPIFISIGFMGRQASWEVSDVGDRILRDENGNFQVSYIATSPTLAMWSHIGQAEYSTAVIVHELGHVEENISRDFIHDSEIYAREREFDYWEKMVLPRIDPSKYKRGTPMWMEQSDYEIWKYDPELFDNLFRK
jgi:RHS repeat-associated protein